MGRLLVVMLELPRPINRTGQPTMEISDREIDQV